MPSIGIARRTALWSWLVTLATLVVFLVVLLPWQEHTLLKSLESKSQSVAISLHEVAASAAVNEDYSSVVDHCKDLLDGDDSIAYLVLVKNDGFALLQDHSGWRSAQHLGSEWRPALRKPSGGIGYVPLFKTRAFDYAQPFDYSGIEWGWIHVGLSLDKYNQSLSNFYWITFGIAVGCGALSLLTSLVYAKLLVDPILNLRETVQRLASGDLSARAASERSDELGSLATSVNLMTAALLRRNQILASVQFAAQRFLGAADLDEAIGDVLERIGRAASVGRAYLVKFERDKAGQPVMRSRHAWTAPEDAAQRPDGGAQSLQGGIERWVETLKGRDIVATRVSEIPQGERALLEAAGIRSTIAIAVVVDGACWGFMRFDDCKEERNWSQAERDSLEAAADMLGAAIARQRAQNALLEAKANLEQRVLDRTEALRRENRERKEAESALVRASRHAGMAEVATGVLHNVGNVLNSVNVSATVVRDTLQGSEVPTLARIARLLADHRDDLGAYLTADPKGRLIPEVLEALALQLGREHELLRTEQEQLSRNIEHIKEIVVMQQNYARVSGILERTQIADLVGEAVQMHSDGLKRHNIHVVRQFSEIPMVLIDKHKVLQIMVNLIQNAKNALEESPSGDRRIVLSVKRASEGTFCVSVEDNGVGIPPENLTRIFSLGFTTRKAGHGFGLHSGAIAAREMGGTLLAASAGSGKGALFTLELPINGEINTHE